MRDTYQWKLLNSQKISKRTDSVLIDLIRGHRYYTINDRPFVDLAREHGVIIEADGKVADSTLFKDAVKEMLKKELGIEKLEQVDHVLSLLGQEGPGMLAVNSLSGQIMDAVTEEDFDPKCFPTYQVRIDKLPDGKVQFISHAAIEKVQVVDDELGLVDFITPQSGASDVAVGISRSIYTIVSDKLEVVASAVQCDESVFPYLQHAINEDKVKGAPEKDTLSQAGALEIGLFIPKLDKAEARGLKDKLLPILQQYEVYLEKAYGVSARSVTSAEMKQQLGDIEGLTLAEKKLSIICEVMQLLHPDNEDAISDNVHKACAVLMVSEPILSAHQSGVGLSLWQRLKSTIAEALGLSSEWGKRTGDIKSALNQLKTKPLESDAPVVDVNRTPTHGL